MRTADEMYDYCRDHDFANNLALKFSLKNFRLIEKNLEADEKVLMVFVGLHNYKNSNRHDKYFAYALTNKRFIMAQKMLIGKRLKALSLNLIDDVLMIGEDLLAIMQIVSKKTKVNVGLGKDQARKIQEKLKAELLIN